MKPASAHTFANARDARRRAVAPAPLERAEDAAAADARASPAARHRAGFARKSAARSGEIVVVYDDDRSDETLHRRVVVRERTRLEARVAAAVAAAAASLARSRASLTTRW